MPVCVTSHSKHSIYETNFHLIVGSLYEDFVEKRPSKPFFEYMYPPSMQSVNNFLKYIQSLNAEASLHVRFTQITCEMSYQWEDIDVREILTRTYIWGMSSTYRCFGKDPIVAADHVRLFWSNLFRILLEVILQEQLLVQMRFCDVPYGIVWRFELHWSDQNRDRCFHLDISIS